MTQLLHSMDSTRPVSCGVNIFFNFLFSMGMGIYSDEKAEKETIRSFASGALKSGLYFPVDPVPLMLLILISPIASFLAIICQSVTVNVDPWV